MVVNFRARVISRSARKLARTPTLKKKKKKVMYELNTRTIDEVIETKFFEKIQLTK